MSAVDAGCEPLHMLVWLGVQLALQRTPLVAMVLTRAV